MSDVSRVNGYVLAGGKSSRMGQDKALLELAGRPLVDHAVKKLRAVCAEVFILSSREELARFAPLVGDVHADCGPIGGFEAALLHSTVPWSLFLAVDMPFVPVDFLRSWVRKIILQPEARVALFIVDGCAQPTLCLVHRDVLPYVQRAVEQHSYRLLPCLEDAVRALAIQQGAAIEAVYVNRVCEEASWFANLNTPEEFAQAEQLWVAGAASSSAEGAS